MRAPVKPPDTFKTTRLLLRKPVAEDIAPLYAAYTSDHDSTRFLSFPTHTRIDQTAKFIDYSDSEWNKGSSYPYVIELAASAVGAVGMIHMRQEKHQLDFGFVIAKPFWGQGYMTEALKYLVNWSLDQPQIWRAVAFCGAENTASARVMEKAGMIYEGTLKRYFVHPNISSEPRDCLLYAKSRP